MTTSENDNEQPPEEEAPSTDAGGELVPAARTGTGTGELVRAPATTVIIPGSPDDPKSHTALLESASPDGAEAWRTLVLLPLLLPIASVAAIFFYVINLSRALLAGGKWGSLVIASILVLAILGVVAWISAHPNLRTSSLAVIVAVLFLVIGATGLTTLGPSEDKSAQASGSSFKPPSGAPVATVEVVAQPGSALAFN